MEDLQAKLCAYIEGELSPADRAQLEQFLATDPQTRALVDELMQMRQTLRTLPRESAPLDLGDSLTAHVERAALFADESAPDASHPRRSYRWPQRLAVAAIVLLATGLGAVVYFVALPPGSTQPPSVASLQTQPQPEPEVEPTPLAAVTPKEKSVADADTPNFPAASLRYRAENFSAPAPSTLPCTAPSTQPTTVPATQPATQP